MKFLRRIDRAFDRFINLMAVFSGILIIFIMLSVGVAVVMRYFFHNPIGWETEVNEYVIVYATFLVIAWVLKKDAHVKIDIVIGRINPKTQSLMNTITSAIGVIVSFILAWYGFKVAWDQYQAHIFTVTLMQLPQWIFTWVVGFGFLLMAIQGIKNTSGYFRSWKLSKIEKVS